MMEFTSIERISIAGLLVGLMNVDGDVDVREILYFNQIQNIIKITNDEFEEGKNQNILISLLVLKSVSVLKKLALAKMIVEMINADGKQDEKEMEFFSIVCLAINLKESDLHSLSNGV